MVYGIGTYMANIAMAMAIGHKQAEKLKSREMVKDEGWRLNDEWRMMKYFLVVWWP